MVQYHVSYNFSLVKGAEAAPTRFIALSVEKFSAEHSANCKVFITIG